MRKETQNEGKSKKQLSINLSEYPSFSAQKKPNEMKQKI